MAKFARDGLPEGFGPPRVWFVLHPETGAAYPAKAVWGLATGQKGLDFISHQARDKLRALGFVVPGPDDPAADPAVTPAGRRRPSRPDGRRRPAGDSQTCDTPLRC